VLHRKKQKTYKDFDKCPICIPSPSQKKRGEVEGGEKI
jgi:hypothetical protein